MLRGLIFYIDILPFFLLALALDLGSISKKETQRTSNIGILRLLFGYQKYSKSPFYIVSTCNFLLLLAMTLLHDYDNYLKYYYDDFRKVDWIRGLITIECMTIICLLAYYIRKVNKFNHRYKFRHLCAPMIRSHLYITTLVSFL